MLQIRGLSGVVTNTNAIGADWNFVAQQFNISMTAPDPWSRFTAGTSGLFIGIFSAPKTIYELGQPNGVFNIALWNAATNQVK